LSGNTVVIPLFCGGSEFAYLVLNAGQQWS